MLSIYSPNKEPFNCIVRELGATYSVTKKMWWLPYSKQSVAAAFDAYKEQAWVDYSALELESKRAKRKGVHTEAPNIAISDKGISSKLRKNNDHLRNFRWTDEQKKAMWAYAKKLEIRDYSKSAFTTYGHFFKQFLAAHPTKDPKDITEEEIINHVIKVVQDNDYAVKTQNQIINTIKFYYEKVLGLEKKAYWIPRPRKETKLPVVASEEEVVRTIVASNNLKHQCIMGLLYSSGLRRGELINLKLADINLDRRQVFVRGGKGKKDRTTILSDRMASALLKYYDLYQPKTWVFEGQNGGQYSGASVGQLVKNAAKKSGS